jgi:hypothetical protein
LLSCLLLQDFHLVKETTEGTFIADKAYWLYGPTLMLSVSIVITKDPGVVLLAQTKVNEDEVVFHHGGSVVYVDLFADDAMASGFAPHLIDFVNSLAVSYSLRQV